MDQVKDRNMESYMEAAFQLFDYDNRGYITLDNLIQITDKLIENDAHLFHCKSNNILSWMTEETLGSMIEYLDSNLDEKIEFKEFQTIWS